MSVDHTISNAIILGCGYTGKTLIRKLRDAGTQVWATTRSEDNTAILADLGATPLVWNAEQPLDMSRYDTAFVLYPPKRHEGQQTAPSELANVNRVVYCSSTGVYGHTNGEWVDESTPTAPGIPRGQRRLLAEQAFQELNAMVVRAGGIYGPNRNMLLRLKSGQMRVTGDPTRMVNLIHVDDLADMMIAAAHRGTPKAIYMGCCGQPTEWRELAKTACELTGLSLPDPTPIPAHPDIASFYTTSRRCRNEQTLEALKLTLTYPNTLDALKVLHN